MFGRDKLKDTKNQTRKRMIDSDTKHGELFLKNKAIHTSLTFHEFPWISDHHVHFHDIL